MSEVLNLTLEAQLTCVLLGEYFYSNNYIYFFKHINHLTKSPPFTLMVIISL